MTTDATRLRPLPLNAERVAYGQLAPHPHACQSRSNPSCEPHPSRSEDWLQTFGLLLKLFVLRLQALRLLADSDAFRGGEEAAFTNALPLSRVRKKDITTENLRRVADQAFGLDTRVTELQLIVDHEENCPTVLREDGERDDNEKRESSHSAFRTAAAELPELTWAAAREPACFAA